MKKTTLISWLLLGLGITLPSLALSADICIPGERTQVLSKGTWLPVTALRAEGEKCLVHYDGSSGQSDEWVGSDRLRLSSMHIPPIVQSLMKSRLPHIGSRIEVLRQKWLPARIKEIKGDSWLVQYEADGVALEEWVGPDQYRW